tara:strand:+ start:1259 stop:1465 length:207 start_codon:yes stop_codon:yes gene_type:complete
MKVSDSDNDFDDDFLSDMSPLTEASCTLQDYMNAWLMYNNDLQKKSTYEECLFEVIKDRALGIQDIKQ